MDDAEAYEKYQREEEPVVAEQKVILFFFFFYGILYRNEKEMLQDNCFLLFRFVTDVLWFLYLYFLFQFLHFLARFCML